MTRLRLWLIGFVALALVIGGVYAWWSLDYRWRPKSIERRQAEIAKLLDGAGWVSPGQTGPKVYVITYGGCADCAALAAEALPKLQAAGVDTRLIVIARADANGLAQSTPVDRTTVAELWLNRSWRLLERWDAAGSRWTAPGLPLADGDMARTAVVEAGRKLAADLKPLLKANGLTFGYPTVIWWRKDGVMRGCVCQKKPSYRFVLKELAA